MITRLPDDIEQYLLDWQRTRATYALMARRNLSLPQARTVIGRWLNERSTELRSGRAQPLDDDG